MYERRVSLCGGKAIRILSCIHILVFFILPLLLLFCLFVFWVFRLLKVPFRHFETVWKQFRTSSLRAWRHERRTRVLLQNQVWLVSKIFELSIKNFPGSLFSQPHGRLSSSSRLVWKVLSCEHNKRQKFWDIFIVLRRIPCTLDKFCPAPLRYYPIPPKTMLNLQSVRLASLVYNTEKERGRWQSTPDLKWKKDDIAISTHFKLLSQLLLTSIAVAC